LEGPGLGGEVPFPLCLWHRPVWNSLPFSPLPYASRPRIKQSPPSFFPRRPRLFQCLRRKSFLLFLWLRDLFPLSKEVVGHFPLSFSPHVERIHPWRGVWQGSSPFPPNVALCCPSTDVFEALFFSPSRQERPDTRKGNVSFFPSKLACTLFPTCANPAGSSEKRLPPRVFLSRIEDVVSFFSPDSGASRNFLFFGRFYSTINSLRRRN